MPKAFVHGNPETSAIWRYLIAALHERGISDTVTLSPPGFGAPTPPGWDATQVAYRDWLVGQLEDLGGNVDLVGHDWGAGHTFGVLAERPDLLRSWAADCAGLCHPDYVWHDAAQAWQTPELGEEMVASMVGGPRGERAEVFESFGMPADVAADVAAGLDEETGRCVLALYRSAAQPALADLGQRLRTTDRRPGLVFMATEDHYAGTAGQAAEVAAWLGAPVVTLENLGHWWMFAGADQAADALITHWENA